MLPPHSFPQTLEILCLQNKAGKKIQSLTALLVIHIKDF